jgi:manganese/iron transport system substrate-binding protein
MSHTKIKLVALLGCLTTFPVPLVDRNLSAQNQTPQSLPTVVVTHSVLCDLTKQIAQDTVNLKCLIAPGSDPHLYQPKPDDRKVLESAQLSLYGGYNFEPSLIKLIKATSNKSPKVAVGEIAVPNPQKFEDEGKVVSDPHIWHNAKNGIKMAKIIDKSLATLRPDRAALYSKNTDKVVAELTQVDNWIGSQIATIPKTARKLVTTHDALGYYAKAYALPLETALGGITTEEQPTPKRITQLVKLIRDAKVPTIFAEVTINPKLINTVAKEAKVNVAKRELFADGLGEKGSEAETYIGMLVANTRTIVEGLGGKFTPFKLK